MGECALTALSVIVLLLTALSGFRALFCKGDPQKRALEVFALLTEHKVLWLVVTVGGLNGFAFLANMHQLGLLG